MNEEHIKRVSEAIRELWDRPEYDLGLPGVTILTWLQDAYDQVLSPEELEDVLDGLVTRQCMHWMEGGDGEMIVFDVQPGCLEEILAEKLSEKVNEQDDGA